MIYNAKTAKIFVGVDVSKATLDVYRTDTKELPELGKLNRDKVAKLVVVAPINRDSGTKSSNRFIGGGRGQVRRVLYMATLEAIRHNAKIRAFYAHLKSKGKECKVPIVACMRKLVTILNLLVKSHQTWVAK